MAEAVHAMKDEGDPEPNRPLTRWEIVCEALRISLKGNELIDLRQQAKELVDQIGDPKIDYRFTKFEYGHGQGTFVVTSSQGLRAFGRRKMRRAS